jgi:fatty acid CoA ligase FadD36
MPLLSALLAADDLDAALTTPEGSFSRHDLLGWAASIAGDLAGAPIVAVHATPGAATVAAIAGALLAGVPVVPIPPDAGQLERDHMLRDSGAALLLADDPEAGGQPAASPGGLPVVPITRAARSASIPAEPAGEAPALVLYTSGTTGAPKGVVISRAAIAADLDALAEAWQWTPADTLVHGLPLYHVHGLVLGALGPLRVGGRLTHTGRPVPDAYAENAGTMYFGVPTVWSRIAGRPDAARRLSAARLLVSGSAPLPAGVFHTLSELTGQAPVERYGMTETLITIGPDGWHRIVGRASTDLIKTGGYRVGAGEVEDALLLHPAVREVAVVGLPDDDLGERITAFVVGDRVPEQELIGFVAERLAAHKRPRRVVRVDELPRNAMGKVQKGRLKTGD